MKKAFCIIFLFCLLLLLPKIVSAAVLYFDPAEIQAGPNDSFALNIEIDVEANCINTVDANISFPQDKIKLIEFLTGDSIINLWVDKPDSTNFTDINSKGLMHLSGGIPGGWCGRIPGDPGFSNIIGQAIFKVPGFSVGAANEPTAKTADINFLDNVRVFINDGFGTLDKLVTRGATVTLSPTPLGLEEKWQLPVREDKTPPEPFIVELHRSDKMFNNQYYIIFTTTDKQSGVDHYEVMEVKPAANISWYENIWMALRNQSVSTPKWTIATMPYLLHDQTLQSIIRVKAVDKAGNEQLVEYIPPVTLAKAAVSPGSIILAIAIAVAAIIIIGLILFILYKRSKHNNEEEKH